MTTFSKIEYVPKVVEIATPHPGTISSTTITDLNQPLFNSGVPQMEDDGIFPILPFDIPFQFTKPAFTPSSEILLYSYPVSTLKIPPYTCVIVEGHILQLAFPFTLSGLFESKALFNPQPPLNVNNDPTTPLLEGEASCNILAGNIEIDQPNSVPFIVVDSPLTQVEYYFRIVIDGNAGYNETWQINGVARFM